MHAAYLKLWTSIPISFDITSKRLIKLFLLRYNILAVLDTFKSFLKNNEYYIMRINFIVYNKLMGLESSDSGFIPFKTIFF